MSGRALIRPHALEFLCSDTRSLAIRPRSRERRSFTSSIMNHNAGSGLVSPVSDISHPG